MSIRGQATSQVALTQPSLESDNAALPALRPIPWWFVATFVVVALAVLTFFTLYLPARQTLIQGNTVHIHDLTVQLSAHPSSRLSNGVDMTLDITPAPGANAAVTVTPSMPTMGNMSISAELQEVSPGRYTALADLGMGGQWEISVVISRPGQPDAVAHFRMNS